MSSFTVKADSTSQIMMFFPTSVDGASELLLALSSRQPWQLTSLQDAFMDTPGVQELHSEMEFEWDWDLMTCSNTCVAEHVPSSVMSISARWVIHSTGHIEF